MNAFEVVCAENIRLILAGNQQAAFDHLVQSVIPVRNQLLKVLHDSVTYQEQQLSDSVASAEQKTGMTERVLVIASGLLALMLCGVIWSVLQLVKRRIQSATHVGRLIANGNLTTEVNATGKDEFQSLLKELERMRLALRDIVSNVREGTDSIATGSSEIAAGSKDLSLRTEQQASSLQQTTSAIAQMAVNIKKTAETASDASQLAQSAKSAALNGGELAGRMSQTMSDLSLIHI